MSLLCFYVIRRPESVSHGIGRWK